MTFPCVMEVMKVMEAMKVMKVMRPSCTIFPKCSGFKDIKNENPVCYDGYEGHIYIYIANSSSIFTSQVPQPTCFWKWQLGNLTMNSFANGFGGF